MTDDTPIIAFPCHFPIKIMGHAADDFAELAFALVARHVEALAPEAMAVNESRQGRFLAVTITIEAQSRAQLDAIYQDLTAHERVVMAL